VDGWPVAALPEQPSPGQEAEPRRSDRPPERPDAPPALALLDAMRKESLELAGDALGELELPSRLERRRLRQRVELVDQCARAALRLRRVG